MEELENFDAKGGHSCDEKKSEERQKPKNAEKKYIDCKFNR